MSSGNGNGHGAVKDLAARPALEEILARQRDVLATLAKPMPNERAVLDWTRLAYQAAVGRVNEGIVDLLSHPDFSFVVSALLRDDGKAGERFRARIERALAAVYARAIEDLSRSSNELVQGPGVARVGFAGSATGANIVR